MPVTKIDTGDGRQLQFQIQINHWTDGAMSVEGNIENKEYALALLENAKQAIRDHHARKEGRLVVPGKDLSLTDVVRLD